MDAEGILVFKKSGGVLAHVGFEDFEDAPFIASALPTVGPLFEEREGLGFVECADGGVIECIKPGEITIGLGRDHDVILLVVAEVAGGALLALAVIRFDRAKGVGAMELDGAAAGLVSGPEGVAEEEVGFGRFDVFGEELADDGVVGVVAGDEEIEERVLEIDRPSARFVDWPGGTMEGEGGKSFLEHAVMGRGGPDAMLGQMKVIIDVKTAEISPGDERIASADEVSADGERFGHGCFHGNSVTTGGWTDKCVGNSPCAGGAGSPHFAGYPPCLPRR